MCSLEVPVERQLATGSVLIIAAIIFSIAYFFHSSHPVNHDVAWFFLVAKGVLSGGTLYRDFVEPNAPLASLSLVPAVLLTGFGHVTAAQALVIYVLALALLSFSISSPLLRRLQLPERVQDIFRVALLLSFCFVPGYNFGQREHLFTLLMTPYVLTAVLRYRRAVVPASSGVLAGLLAGIAIGVKPPAILVAISIEAAIYWRYRRLASVLSKETLAMLGCLAAITVHVLLAYPLYLTDVAGWSVAVYGGYNDPALLVGGLLLFSAFLMVVLLLAWPRGQEPSSDLRRILVAAALGSMLVYVAQGKGWWYQAYPLVFFIALLSGLLLAEALPAIDLLRCTAAAMIVCFLTWWMWISSVHDRTRITDIDAKIRQTPGAFYILSTNVYPAFPLALETGHPWASRFPCLIMLPGLVKSAAEGRASRFEPIFRGAVVEDIVKYHPSVIFVPLFRDQALPPDFDELGWFLRDPGFAREWAHYKRTGTADRYAVYERL